VTLNGSTPVAFLASTDLDRARAFFGGNLGLPLITDDGFACVFQAGPISMRVTLVDKATTAPYTVFGWLVGAIAQSIDDLRSAGVSFERFEGMKQDQRGIWTAPGGAQIAWFKDPDGNVLSLTQLPLGD
jgi:catechol 2,3-dioxygenase-like lactoylglutathione lyase family enzyme